MPTRWLVRAALMLACSLAAGGCSSAAKQAPPQQVEEQPLVSYGAWTGVSRDEDPFVTDASATPQCLGPGFYPEEDLAWLEIDTRECSWVTIRANAETSLAASRRLRVVVSHYDLNAPAPAEAELRLMFGRCQAWTKTIAIPSPAAVYREEVDSPCGIDAGGEVLFHLHNHGQNTWQLQELTALR